MRTLIVIVVICIVMILLPIWWLTPPLMVEEPENDEVVIVRNLSEPAQAGRMTFGAQCAQCHGKSAEGGAAPGLLDRVYAVDFRDAPAFHSKAQSAIPEHDAFMKRTQGYGRLGFNDLEMMAKFLREMRRYVAENGLK